MADESVSPNAFRVCLNCGGRGFLREGVIPDARFLKCKSCKGIGQIYLAPKGEEDSSG